jgi:Spy/CpxP family protein refolding chaperone
MKIGEAMMDKNSKNRWQLRVAAVVIFVLGFAAGALALNAYRAWPRGSGQVSREDRFAQMSERLKFNDAQKTQVQQILGDTREQLQALRKESEPRVKEIRERADERLQKVLTPEQWQQFQQIRDEMRGKDRRGRDSSGNGSPSPGEH